MSLDRTAFETIAQGPLFWLPCTLLLYAGAVFLSGRSNKHPALNPTLLTIAGIAALLFVTRVPYAQYFEAVAVINYLLGTAVVALAVPLYRNLARLKGCARQAACALLVGSLASILAGLVIAMAVGASVPMMLSLAPKSATAAVSIEIARIVGGIPAITAMLTILTGIAGAVIGPMLLDLAGIRAPEARGLALGVASHGIATARAFSESEVAGGFASLGMALNAVLTALLVPPIVKAFGFL